MWEPPPPTVTHAVLYAFFPSNVARSSGESSVLHLRSLELYFDRDILSLSTIELCENTNFKSESDVDDNQGLGGHLQMSV